MNTDWLWSIFSADGADEHGWNFFNEGRKEREGAGRADYPNPPRLRSDFWSFTP
jgi:hypothetical protein